MTLKNIALTATLLLLALGLYVLVRHNNVHAGHIIMINGTSSAGKSTLIAELKKIYGTAYDVVAIDVFGWEFEKAHPRPTETELKALDEATKKQMLEQRGQAFIEGFYGSARDKAKQGRIVLVDTIDEDLVHAQRIWKDVASTTVLLYCPLPVAFERVKERNRSGKPEEERNQYLPAKHYISLYKPQEAPTEQVVDTISSAQTKLVIQKAIELTLKNLPAQYKTEEAIIRKEFEETYTKAVKQFGLDKQERVAIVPRKPHDLVLDCRHTPQELAQEVVKALKK